MALSACGLAGPARRAYQWLRDTQRPDGSWPRTTGGPSAAEPGRGGRPGGGKPPRRLRRGRRVARVPGHRRPRVRRARCGRPSAPRSSWVLDLQAPRGEVAWERDAAGEPGDVRAAVRLLEHPAGAALRDRARRAGRRAAAGLGARGRPARPRARLPPGGVRGQEPVRDGLVLPGARRRAARRGRRGAARPRLGHVRRAGPRRPLRQRPAVGDGRGDLRARALPRRLRPARAGARGVRRGRRLRHEDGSYWTGWQYVNENHFPAERSELDLRRRRARRRRADGFSGGAGIFRAIPAPPATLGPPAYPARPPRPGQLPAARRPRRLRLRGHCGGRPR